MRMGVTILDIQAVTKVDSNLLQQGHAVGQILLGGSVKGSAPHLGRLFSTDPLKPSLCAIGGCCSDLLQGAAASKMCQEGCTPVPS